ncbi:hypothetical protein T10_83 [Trichinella papuae]|uniref:Uncharacterized protein n=1 Tax=Trichinella papuae TaxID=268474 RepID=A0A0V1M974_9BILA|nr:hypothetical protein T10_83 [Trichinella papuae]
MHSMRIILFSFTREIRHNWDAAQNLIAGHMLPAGNDLKNPAIEHQKLLLANRSLTWTCDELFSRSKNKFLDDRLPYQLELDLFSCRSQLD